MRLLNTTTLKLHEFFDAEIPQYAILSHTWGAEEVTFQEMTDVFDEDGCQCGKATRRAKLLAKSGYEKILACCRLATRDDLQYAWIDTCCIDKRSSAELSEAINSMWLWYERSVICYVYLQDVESQDVQSADNFERELTRCRWITRGWCLQELLAPRNVLFLAHDWTALGFKTYLFFSRWSERYSQLPIYTTSISRTTGIPEAALSICKRRHYSIAQRMSWAADRQTTRREDMAYCLIGLFDINMPLLYGERHRAFIRLQEELIRSQADHSILVFETAAVDGGLAWALASSPTKFKRFGNIRKPENDTFPYRMTNSGLEITLDVGLWHDQLGCIALLNCWDSNWNQMILRLSGDASVPIESETALSVCRAAVNRNTPMFLSPASIQEFKKNGSVRRQKLLIAREPKSWLDWPIFP